jgi:CRISPR system Cascade subunit CasB
MSEFSMNFVNRLQGLCTRNRGALAILRRSLSFAPGAFPPAYPYVERFVGTKRKANDPFRLALYLVAGLYATHPKLSGDSFAAAMGELAVRRQSNSIENRFLALLGADAENLGKYLRPALALFAIEDQGINYAALLDDVSVWLDRYATEKREYIRQRWAREFYTVLAQFETESSTIVNAEKE